MPEIKTDQIQKALQLPRLGTKTAFKLFNLLNLNLNDNELYEFILENQKILRLPEYTPNDWLNALKKFEIISDINEKHGIKCVSFYNKHFPQPYKSLKNCPILLNYIGNISEINNRPSTAIIGTRSPTVNGLNAAVRFGEIFGEAKFNVISGLAIGCDTGAHKGCLNKKGYTTAILAHGLDYIYPKENKNLAFEILDKGGLLLTEYNAGQKPITNYFVERDRLQAGLSNGIIVVETDITGGTMHTTKFAAENNKRIAAYAHNNHELLTHPKTRGNQLLINEGKAFPLAKSDDVANYMHLLRDDYNTRSPVIYGNECKKNNKKENQDNNTQFNLFE